ncbi:MAG: dephospho-CoA kinase [Deltaproteobacteria bacterium]
MKLSKGGYMRIIGLTGGIGAGKSTTAKILESLGASIIDADEIAKELLKNGNKAYNEIVNFFGTEILGDDKEINRKKLADIVFNDRQKLAVLNDITHKEVYRSMDEIIDNLKQKNYKGIVVLDVPIPNEDFKKMTDEIWVVDCDDEIRIDRIIKRMGIAREEAVQRIKSQIKREDYLRLAKNVIRNAGTEEELRTSVINLLEE